MLETALAFTATTTVSIRMHRLAVAIMEPTGIDRRRNYGAGFPGVALDASKCTLVLICIFHTQQTKAETYETR